MRDGAGTVAQSLKPLSPLSEDGNYRLFFARYIFKKALFGLGWLLTGLE